MTKIDCERNQYVASYMVSEYSWVTSATVNCEETFGVDDINFTTRTVSGEDIEHFAEVKTIMGGPLKFDGQWSNWYSTMNPCGIMKNLKFGNVPPPSMDILDVPHFWEPETFAPTDEPMPEEWEGKHIYILNAEDKFHRIQNGKTYKVYQHNATVVYLASDGLLFFSPSKLRKAFLGYAWFLNKSHTEEYNKKYEPVWELKAIFDLDGGSYHAADVPKELTTKKH